MAFYGRMQNEGGKKPLHGKKENTYPFGKKP